MKHRVGLVVLLAALFAVSAPAQVPAGGEFQVNTYTTSWQYGGRGFGRGGNFVVVWESTARTAAATASSRSATTRRVRREAAEFRVNSYTTGYQ